MLSLLFVPPPSSVDEAIADHIFASAIGLIARGGFTHRCSTFRYRVDLLEQDGFDPEGNRGAVFRADVEDPSTGKSSKVTFAVPRQDVQIARRFPSLVTKTTFIN